MYIVRRKEVYAGMDPDIIFIGMVMQSVRDWMTGRPARKAWTKG